MGKARSRSAFQSRAFKEKRSQGHGADYTPWLQIRRNEFASRGRSTISFDAETGRPCDTLSDGETFVRRQVKWAAPLDVREQYPLRTHDVEFEFSDLSPLPSGTLEIARTLGYRHPVVKKGEPLVLSLDFLVTMAVGISAALYVKPKKDLDTETRVARERREIAKLYFEQRGCHWLEVKHEDVDRNVTEWLGWCLTDTNARGMSVGRVIEFVHSLSRTPIHLCMRDRLEAVSRNLGVSSDDCILRLKRAVYWRYVSIPRDHTHDLSLSWSCQVTLTPQPLPPSHFLAPIVRLQGGDPCQ